MDVVKRIEQLMTERGWTMYRLAKESGIPVSTVNNWFLRNNVPSVATLEVICSGLGITLAQFFAEQNMIEASPELLELFNDWVNLSADQKQIVRSMIKALCKE